MHTRIQGQRVVVSAVTAAAAALWIGGIAGCASDNGNTDADYVKVCKDPATGERVEDKKCDDDTGPASHSQAYLDAGKTESAHDAVVFGAKILAGTAEDLIVTPGLLDEIQEEFRSNKAALDAEA